MKMGRWLTSAASLAFVMSACGGGAEECVKDTDCKGARVCQLGACVDAPGGQGGGQPTGGGTPMSGCLNDNDCPGALECEMGVCVSPTNNGGGGGGNSSPSCPFGKDDECPAGFWCQYEQCVATTLGRTGETCIYNSDCAGGLCIVRSGTNATFGLCSKRCESFSVCPTFWSCKEAVAGATGKYCVP